MHDDHRDSQLLRAIQRGLIASARAAAKSIRSSSRQTDSGNSEGFDGDAGLTPPFQSFPGYQVLGELHRGGQGIVYHAIQISTRRKVAIKVMKDGPFASTIEKARFDREVHILGKIRHPNIVAIHGTGVVGGCHYFVMDFIQGRSLDAYASCGQPVDAILRLFIKISEAVSAAHVHGIIHRDLKPTNILIDDQGEPQILDFGLAKAGANEGHHSVITVTGEFVGSLPWASPEQAEGTASTIDLRTDVYSLGIMLFQTLTGEFPYSVIGAMRVVLDRIINAEPRRPRALRTDLDEEVETIVLKCIEKIPGRRYQNAGELARDLHNYLSGEPIDAKRDSAMYVLRKKLRKHRISVGVAAAFFLTIVGGFIVSLAGWSQAAVQREAATRQLERAEAASRAEALERERAAREGETSKQVTKFLVGLFGAADASQTSGRSLTVQELLKQGAIRLEHELSDQPLVQATLLLTIGSAYSALGLFDEALLPLNRALQLREAALGPEDLAVAEALDQIALNWKWTSRYEPAEAYYRRSLEIRREKLGDAHGLVGRSLSNVAETIRGRGNPAEAESFYRDALQILQHTDADQPVHAEVLNNLAGCLSAQSKYNQAEQLYRKTLEMRRNLFPGSHSDVAQALNNLCLCLQVQGKFEEAEPLCRESVATFQSLYDGVHPGTAAALDNLARCLLDQGRIAEAEPIIRDVLAMDSQVFGDENPNTALSKNRLGECLLEKGDLSNAEVLFREALATTRTVLGDRHPRTGNALYSLARALEKKGDYPMAESTYSEAMAIWRAEFPGDHIDVAKGLGNLGFCLCNQGRYDEGESLCRESAEMRERILGYKDWQVATALHRAARCQLLRGQCDKAAALLGEVLRLRRTLLHDDHPHIIETLADLGLASELSGKFAEAEQLYREAQTLHDGKEDNEGIAALESNLAFVLLTWGRALESADLAKHAREVLDTRLPKAHSHLMLANAAFGLALSGQGRFAEAEPLLADNCAILAMRNDVARGRRHTLIERVIEHYESWDAIDPSSSNAAQASKFRSLLAFIESAG